MPNLIITGSPGTGKTSTVLCIARKLLNHYDEGVLEFKKKILNHYKIIL